MKIPLISFWFYRIRYSIAGDTPAKGQTREWTRSWTQFWCRLRGHPDGPAWNNSSGLEPDMRCQNCGEWL